MDLSVVQIGSTLFENTRITIDDIKSIKLRTITLEKKEKAHIAVYYVGDSVQKTTFGQSGCIGCICRPDWRKKTRSGRSKWVPNGSDPDFKHCIVSKTKNETNQGKV